MKCEHKKYVYLTSYCWCYECGALTRVGVTKSPLGDGWQYGIPTGKPAKPEQWMEPVGAGGKDPSPLFFGTKPD